MHSCITHTKVISGDPSAPDDYSSLGAEMTRFDRGLALKMPKDSPFGPVLWTRGWLLCWVADGVSAGLVVAPAVA